MQQITVNLQEPFSYFSIIVWIVIGLIGTLLILFLRIKLPQKKASVPKPRPVAPQSLATLKDKYSRVLADIQNSYSIGKITERQAFQALSRVVRDFVFDATGIKVQNYTLTEIHAANLPQLYALISQCYIPEFAMDTDSDFIEVINKARKVILEWN